jgi:molybdate transport system substrate-binding protein
VVVVPSGNGALQSIEELGGPKVRRVALGEPASVPVGKYARDALTMLNVWKAVEGKAIYAKDARAVLTYVETGHVDAGLVYATDAARSSRVRVATSIPPSSHPPITYPAAVVKDARHPDAAAKFLAFLMSEPARTILAKHGFTAP